MELQLGYIGLSVLMMIIIYFIAARAINDEASTARRLKRKPLVLIIGLVLWHLYLFLIAQSGFLQDFSFPPRVVLVVILPAFLFTGIFIFRNRNKQWIQNIPPHWMLFYQTFRILIETLFVFSVAKGVLPYQVTIQGYNMDLVFALTATVIGFMVYKGSKHSINLAIAWNFLGLAVIATIIFLFMSTIYFAEFFGSSEPIMSKEFGVYPYPLVAGFLMPSAVFMHVLSIVQLIKSKKNEVKYGKLITSLKASYQRK